MNTEGMIKSIRKIKAVINNAKLFLDVIDEYGTFDNFIWSFTDYKTIVCDSHATGVLPSRNELSDRISGELRKVGSMRLYR